MRAQRTHCQVAHLERIVWGWKPNLGNLLVRTLVHLCGNHVCFLWASEWRKIEGKRREKRLTPMLDFSFVGLCHSRNNRLQLVHCTLLSLSRARAVLLPFAISNVCITHLSIISLCFSLCAGAGARMHACACVDARACVNVHELATKLRRQIMNMLL